MIHKKRIFLRRYSLFIEEIEIIGEMKMLNKLSREEIIKGYVGDYSKIKEEFKEMLRTEGFRWNRAWERQNAYGKEGVWFNPVLKISIRIRWGIANPSAIIYVEKEFIEKIEKFFDYHGFSDGIDTPNLDYDLLNKGDILILIRKNKDKEIKKSTEVEGVIERNVEGNKEGNIEIIEGNIAYLEKKKDKDDIRIVAVGGFEARTSIDKLGDFLKKTWLSKEIKEELEFLITEANIKWFKGVKYGYTYTNMFGDRILIGPFVNIEDAKKHQKKRRKSIMKEFNPIFDKKPRIVKWDMKRYEYIYTPEQRVIKEPVEMPHYLPIR